MARIKNIIAREILDSRGNPTVEVELFFAETESVIASIPSGASTGSKEALEIKDNDQSRYNGKGVLKAIENINRYIKPYIINQEINQYTIDELLKKIDGTDNKSKIGANAILAVSLACLKAQASAEHKELYEFIAYDKISLPIPMMNIINGGMHADNKLSFQEFMIVPVVKSFKERLRVGAEIYHILKRLLEINNLASSVGDEGGFVPQIESNVFALELINKAILLAGYVPGKDVYMALDVAASSIYNESDNTYIIDGKKITPNQLYIYYSGLINRFPIMSIEDPFEENDLINTVKLTKEFGERIMIVGDDLFVTNKALLKHGIEVQAANAILLKANQIGTITEMVETMYLAKQHQYETIISHRSGETEDTFIADLAVGLNIKYIKTGAPARGERTCKYNRLLRIEEKLNNS